MRLVIESVESGFKLHLGDGCGWLWTNNPELILQSVREGMERFMAAQVRLARDGAPHHFRVVRGLCPTCGLPPEDCVGEEFDE